MIRKSISNIHYTSHYLEACATLPLRIQRLQDRKEQLFKDNPYHTSLQTHKLKGKYREYYSYWVTDNWRVLFKFLENNEVIFYDIDTHEIYR